MLEKSEIRKHFFLEKYVIIAPKRQARPHSNEPKPMAPCAFCPENIDWNNVLECFGKQNNWSALSIKNIYPAVSLDNSSAYGQQEVIIESPLHGKKLSELGLEGTKQLLKVFAHRTAYFASTERINYILCFKNQGRAAGASLEHSHSQFFASEIIPPDIQEEKMAVKQYKKDNLSCPYCDLARQESSGPCSISQNTGFLSFCPSFSQFNYEAWIVSRQHKNSLADFRDQDFSELASLLHKIICKLDEAAIPYNFFIHQDPKDKEEHFCLKIEPRLSIWAGLELGSGLVINSVYPDEAAAFYRNNYE